MVGAIRSIVNGKDLQLEYARVCLMKMFSGGSAMRRGWKMKGLLKESM